MGLDSTIYSIMTLFFLMLMTVTLAEASGEARVTLALAGRYVKIAMLTAAHTAWIPWNLWLKRKRQNVHWQTHKHTQNEHHELQIFDHFTQISFQCHCSRTVILAK